MLVVIIRRLPSSGKREGIGVQERSGDWRQALRAEFSTEEGTFLATALGGRWDKAAFGRLARLLRRGCLDAEGREVVEKWVAEGYHHLDTQFDRYLPPSLGLKDELVEDIREHLMLLANWYFSGQCSLKDPSAMEAELVALLARCPTAD